MQTDWSGGASIYDTNASNYTCWNKYVSADANADTSGGDLKLGNSHALWSPADGKEILSNSITDNMGVDGAVATLNASGDPDGNAIVLFDINNNYYIQKINSDGTAGQNQ